MYFPQTYEGGKTKKSKHLKGSSQFHCYWWTLMLIIMVLFLRYMVRTTSDKQISRTFQRFLKDKLQFSRSNIYSINQHSFTPFWTPYWLKHVKESFFDFNFFSHGWSHYLILLYTMFNTLQNDWLCLAIASEYRNSIWNKETEMKYCLPFKSQ